VQGQTFHVRKYHSRLIAPQKVEVVATQGPFFTSR
jgi:hypothetical protein